MEYLKLFEALWKNQVRYLICGGLPVNIYGIPRMTADIELLLDFEKENLNKFWETLKSLSYLPLAPIPVHQLNEETFRIQLEKEKNMLAYSFYNKAAEFMNIDVLIKVPFPFEELWSRKESRSRENFQINLISVLDLIEMKQYANRKQDQDDVILLSKLLKRWATLNL